MRIKRLSPEDRQLVGRGNFLLGPGEYGVASRLHQKDAEAALEGHGTGSESYEAGGVINGSEEERQLRLELV